MTSGFSQAYITVPDGARRYCLLTEQPPQNNHKWSFTALADPPLVISTMDPVPDNIAKHLVRVDPSPRPVALP